MKKHLLTLLFLLSTVGVFAQSGSVKGIVRDESTKEPVIGAKVLVKGSSTGAVTDVNGAFVINSLADGNYTLEISFLGYKTHDQFCVVRGGKAVNIGYISIKEATIATDEVEIVADVVDMGRQKPTPITTISAAEIEEKMGAQEFPELLKATPGVFVSTGSGAFGDSNVRIRGFGSRNSAVLINGIPVNDMENGRVYWSNWGGMGDVTYNKQVQRGLGASKLAVSSVGGTMNIITKPTDFKKRFQVKYANANRSWQHYVSLSASSGLLKGGWAFTGLLSTRQGEGFREGTNTEAYSYFLTASKSLGKRHQLVLTGFGAPQLTKRGYSATQVTYETVGRKTYNKTWGYRNGEKFNSNQNRYHKPMIFLNHYFDVKKNALLTTSVYYSFGRGGGLGIDRGPGAVNPIPFNLGSGAPERLWQLNWDTLITQNQNNFKVHYDINGKELIRGNLSKYVLRESRNDHDWAGALTTYNVDFSEKTSGTFGIDYRWYRGYHYRKLVDLLGGDYFIDVNRNSDFTSQSGLNGASRNRKNESGIVQEGDKYDYNYTGTVTWLGAFAQIEHEFENIDVFLTLNAVNSGFQRNGLFLNDDFINSSLGKSEKKTFFDFTIKTGLNYKFDGRHNAFLNMGFFTRAPYFREAFMDGRYSNEIRGDLESEIISSLELGYSYRSTNFAANLNLYRTTWSNQAMTSGFLTPINAVFEIPQADGSIKDFRTEGGFLQFRITDVDAIHTGAEVDISTKLTSTVSLTGMFSIGDWRWNDNANALVFTDPGFTSLTPDGPTKVYIDDLKIGGVPQMTVALGPYYRSPKYWYAGASLNYYDLMYEDYSPDQRLVKDDYFRQVRKLPSAFTLDVRAGKSWKLKSFHNLYIKLKGSINNVLDNQFVTDSRQRTDLDPQASPFVQYYFGRTYYVGLTLSF